MQGLCSRVLLGVATFLFPAAAGAADAQVRLQSELGQPVMMAGQGGKVWLRVGLDGIPLPEEVARPPVNVALVIDKSGSMNGERIAQAREAALMAVERLGEGDVLGVIAYDSSVHVLAPTSPLRDIAALRRDIDSLTAGGSTALYAGTAQGIRELREFVDPYRVSRVILLSDGMANVGPSSPAALEALGREAGRDGIAVTTIGLGLGYNEDLMTRLALASDGNHAFVEHPDQLVDIFNAEFGDVLSVVAQDVEIIIDCPEGFEPIRSLGREAQIEGRQVKVRLNQVYGKQEKYVVLEFAVDEDAARAIRDFARVKVAYTDMKTRKRMTVEETVRIRFTSSAREAEDSLDKGVMAAVATQIAIEQNEKAVQLRDAGKVEEAREILEGNAAYLEKEAKRLGPQAAPALRSLSERNQDAAENLDSESWRKRRKMMRRQQYKGKVQQSY